MIFYVNLNSKPYICFWRNEQEIVHTVHLGQNPKQNKQPQPEICDNWVICLLCVHTLSDWRLLPAGRVSYFGTTVLTGTGKHVVIGRISGGRSFIPKKSRFLNQYDRFNVHISPHLLLNYLIFPAPKFRSVMKWSSLRVISYHTLDMRKCMGGATVLKFIEDQKLLCGSGKMRHNAANCIITLKIAWILKKNGSKFVFRLYL